MFQTSYKRIGIALVGMLMSLSPLFGALPAGYTQLALQGASAGKSTVVDSVTLRCLRKMPSGLTVIIK